ncbi:MULTISPECIES: phage virion morphogenesis protein [Sphingobacterium]|uniref:phage virion morphogenesis protein n=1 Tax=Sphingobacterium TaxID=28453 RepID=UPI00257E6D04|nr:MULTISPECIES: phage virion morphogenesis protein [Sphingobacterium]
MSNQQNIADFFKDFERRVNYVKEALPEIVGTEVVNSALDNFKTESYFGEKWKERKDKKNKKKLLVNTGTLQRSPRVILSSPGMVTVGSDVPYAEVHNDGGTISRASRSETFIRNRYKNGSKKGRFKKGTTDGQGQTYKAYSYSMPMRKFLGPHPKLKAHLQETIKDFTFEQLMNH